MAVLAASAAWVATGEFSSVGSAADPAAQERQQPRAEARQVPIRTVSVAKPPRVSHARVVRVSGLTEADKRAQLATRAGGIVGELEVRQGDTVEAGDLIMRLAVEDREAAVETARQVLAQRQAEFEAAERLARSGNLPRLQADTARSALASARLQLESALADLSRNEVRAPFSGVVDRVRVENGSAVMQGADVATILALDPVIAVGEVSERELGLVSIGDRAEIRLVDGRRAEGEVRYVSREASSQTRTFRVEVAVANPDLSIPAGMTTEISLRAAEVDSVALPRSVVTLGPAGELGVRSVDPEGIVTFHPIDIVDDTGSALLLAGIPADARIIVSGQDLVADGERVNAVEADPETVRNFAAQAGLAPTGAAP